MNKIIRVYDNGGKTSDRYLVVLAKRGYVMANPAHHPMLSMSDEPSHPQGVSLFGEGRIGKHLGKRIKFDDLPEKVRIHALERLADGEAA